MAEDEQLIARERGAGSDDRHVRGASRTSARFSGNVDRALPGRRADLDRVPLPGAGPWEIDNIPTVCGLCPPAATPGPRCARARSSGSLSRNHPERRRGLALRQGPLRLRAPDARPTATPARCCAATAAPRRRRAGTRRSRARPAAAPLREPVRPGRGGRRRLGRADQRGAVSPGRGSSRPRAAARCVAAPDAATGAWERLDAVRGQDRRPRPRRPGRDRGRPRAARRRRRARAAGAQGACARGAQLVAGRRRRHRSSTATRPSASRIAPGPAGAAAGALLEACRRRAAGAARHRPGRPRLAGAAGPRRRGLQRQARRRACRCRQAPNERGVRRAGFAADPERAGARPRPASCACWSCSATPTRVPPAARRALAHRLQTRGSRSWPSPMFPTRRRSWAHVIAAGDRRAREGRLVHNLEGRASGCARRSRPPAGGGLPSSPWPAALGRQLDLPQLEARGRVTGARRGRARRSPAGARPRRTCRRANGAPAGAAAARAAPAAAQRRRRAAPATLQLVAERSLVRGRPWTRAEAALPAPGRVVLRLEDAGRLGLAPGRARAACARGRRTAARCALALAADRRRARPLARRARRRPCTVRGGERRCRTGSSSRSIKAFVLVNLLMGFFGLMTVIERKLIGRLQARYGPNRVGPCGLLQPIADLGKLAAEAERRSPTARTAACSWPRRSSRCSRRSRRSP